jgi:hypothetical protein
MCDANYSTVSETSDLSSVSMRPIIRKDFTVFSHHKIVEFKFYRICKMKSEFLTTFLQLNWL